jgi:hypothetical protein
MMPIASQNIFSDLKRSAIMRFSSDFVPQSTEAMLQSRKSISNVEFGKDPLNGLQQYRRPIKLAIKAKELASEVDPVGEQHAITMCEVVLENILN